jgi:hypothetical protein
MVEGLQKIFEQHGRVVNRFSVITPRQLDQIHLRYSPEELLGVEIVNQTQDSVAPKAAAGKALERRARTTDPNRLRKLRLSDSEEATIACVSGLLINMPKGTIRLVAPTGDKEQWPDGYKVFGEADFSSPTSFSDSLDQLLADTMTVHPRGNEIARFRSDLKLIPTEAGFRLETSGRAHCFESPGIGPKLGHLISAGDLTYQAIAKEMVHSGANLFAVQDSLDRIFQAGVLRESVDLERRGSTGAPTST